MDKPQLTVDLSGPDGNVFVLIGKTCVLLTDSLLEHFIFDILIAMSPGAIAGYDKMLAIIAEYVKLQDTSGTYPQYAVPKDE